MEDAPASIGRRNYGLPLKDSWRSHHQPLLASLLGLGVGLEMAGKMAKHPWIEKEALNF